MEKNFKELKAVMQEIGKGNNLSCDFSTKALSIKRYSQKYLKFACENDGFVGNKELLRRHHYFPTLWPFPLDLFPVPV